MGIQCYQVEFKAEYRSHHLPTSDGKLPTFYTVLADPHAVSGQPEYGEIPDMITVLKKSSLDFFIRQPHTNTRTYRHFLLKA
jgi:hypothetical protein